MGEIEYKLNLIKKERDKRKQNDFLSLYNSGSKIHKK